MVFHWMVGAGMQFRVNQISFPGFIGLTQHLLMVISERDTQYTMHFVVFLTIGLLLQPSQVY